MRNIVQVESIYTFLWSIENLVCDTRKNAIQSLTEDLIITYTQPCNENRFEFRDHFVMLIISY